MQAKNASAPEIKKKKKKKGSKKYNLLCFGFALDVLEEAPLSAGSPAPVSLNKLMFC